MRNQFDMNRDRGDEVMPVGWFLSSHMETIPAPIQG